MLDPIKFSSLQPVSIISLTPSITHCYSHLLSSKVIIMGHASSVLVPCSCFGFRPSPIHPKGVQQPPTFRPIQAQNPNGISIGSAVFLRSSPQSVRILYNGPPLFPLKNCRFLWGYGFLGPPDSSIQTVSRSVQPLLKGSLLDRPRDHAIRSVTRRIYTHVVRAMQSNNTPCLKNVPPLACYNVDTRERISTFFAEMLPIK